MSSDWSIVRLGNIIDITSSKRVKRADYVESGIPFFRSKEIIELSKGNDISTELFITDDHFQEIYNKFGAPKEGDILLTSVGTLGIPYQVQKNDNFYFKDGNLTWFRNFKESINSRFLYYWLTSKIAKIKFDEVTIGSTQKALTIVALKSIELSIPSLSTQEYIVSILDSLNGKLVNNRQINQTLEQMAQALFKSWFVDFDPVKAKISAKEVWINLHGAIPATDSPFYADYAQSLCATAMSVISGKTTAQLEAFATQSPEQYQSLKATADLFPDAMQESELGDVPEGWDAIRLENVLDLAYGKALKKTERIAGVFPVYGSGGLTGCHNESLINGPGIIIGRKGTVGSIYWEDNAFFPIDTVFYVKPKEEFTFEFIYYLIQTLGLKDMNTDAAVPGLNRNNVYRLEVPSFPAVLVKKFSVFVGTLRSTIKNNKSNTQSLTQLRDTLLPKLLSGEISPLKIEIIGCTGE